MCDQPGDPKRVAKRREQSRLAKRHSRQKKKHDDQVTREGKEKEVKGQEGGAGGGISLLGCGGCWINRTE
jgi:hypothetical protein